MLKYPFYRLLNVHLWLWGPIKRRQTMNEFKTSWGYVMKCSHFPWNYLKLQLMPYVEWKEFWTDELWSAQRNFEEKWARYWVSSAWHHTSSKSVHEFYMNCILNSRPKNPHFSINEFLWTFPCSVCLCCLTVHWTKQVYCRSTFIQKKTFWLRWILIQEYLEHLTDFVD